MVFGIGAFWENRDDMVPEFLRQHCACIGWSREDDPRSTIFWNRFVSGVSFI